MRRFSQIFQYFLLLIFLTTSTLVSFGQSANSPFEIGFRGGVVNYQGDLHESIFTFYSTQPYLGLMASYAFSDLISARAIAEIGSISADDANSKSLASRGFKFSSPIKTFELHSVFHFMRGSYSRGGIYKIRVRPYMFLGVGYLNANATVIPTKEEDKGLFPEKGDVSDFLIIPVGLGGKAEVLKGITVGAEVSSKPTFSDYVDGVSENGHSDANDWLWSGSVFVSIRIGN